MMSSHLITRNSTILPVPSPPLSLPSQGHRKWITGLAWEPAHLCLPSRRVASSSRDGDIRVWDVPRRATQFIMSGHTLAVTCVKWGGDGVIYSGYELHTMKGWHAMRNSIWCCRQWVLDYVSAVFRWLMALRHYVLCFDFCNSFRFVKEPTIPLRVLWALRHIPSSHLCVTITFTTLIAGPTVNIPILLPCCMSVCPAALLFPLLQVAGLHSAHVEL